ncbi:MAG: NAD-binding protein, partial [Hyphomicrobiaceae bacterium]
MGGVGAGHTTKALNNMLLAVNTVAVSEIMSLAVKAGLDAGKVITAINGSSGRSYVTDVRFPNYVMKGDYSHAGGMALALLVKDVAIACETARANDDTGFLVGNVIHQMLLRIGGELGMGAPNHSIARAIENWAGVEIRWKDGQGPKYSAGRRARARPDQYVKRNGRGCTTHARPMS